MPTLLKLFDRTQTSAWNRVCPACFLSESAAFRQKAFLRGGICLANFVSKSAAFRQKAFVRGGMLAVPTLCELPLYVLCKNMPSSAQRRVSSACFLTASAAVVEFRMGKRG